VASPSRIFKYPHRAIIAASLHQGRLSGSQSGPRGPPSRSPIQARCCPTIARYAIRIYPSPAGGACITVGDLTTFRRALVEVRPLGPELTAAMLIPYARAEGYLPQGYGWSSGSTA